MEFDWLVLVVIGLTTWRLAHMTVYEDGPMDVFRRLREAVGIKHDDEGNVLMVPERTVPKLMSCVACMSVWMAGFAYLMWRVEPIFCYVMAASAGAMLMDRRAG